MKISKHHHMKKIRGYHEERFENHVEMVSE